MIRIFIVASVLCMTSTACSETTKVEDQVTEARPQVVNPTRRTERATSNPDERAVRIGEGGPRFDACQSIGKASGLPSGDLDVLVAPFASAKEKGNLKAGQRVYICTRSHDQRWFGIVYADAAPADGGGAEGNDVEASSATELGDCGVSSPVRSKRNYDGPCKSGWVESNFVKLVAG